MNQIFGQAGKYIGLGLYNGTVEVAHRLYQQGVIKSAYRTYNLVGLEKFSKVILASIDLVHHHPAMKGVFTDMRKTFNDQKDVYYAAMVVDSLSGFVRVRNGRINFYIPDIVEVLYAIGNVCETGKFLQKQGVFRFEQCTQIANRLGSVKVFNVKPFNYRPLANFTQTPKDPFVFAAIGITLARSFKELTSPSGHTEVAREANRRRQLSPDNILRQVGNVGKLYLIWNGATSYHTLTFAIVNFVTQNAGLIGFLIKQR
jgi:hypothetical protein